VQAASSQAARAKTASPSSTSAVGDLRPSEQARRTQGNGLGRLQRVGVKVDEAAGAGEGAAGDRAGGTMVKVGFDRKQPRRDFAEASPGQKKPEASGANGAQPMDASSVAALSGALAEYFGKLGKPQPPMHITDRASFEKLRNIGHLDAPYRNRATWSFSGMLAKGEVAIRLKPGAEKFVELVPSVETFGQVPNYYPKGVGKGDFRKTVPADHLQYFDMQSRQWAAVKG